MFLPVSSFIVLLHHLPLLLNCSPGYGTGWALVSLGQALLWIGEVSPSWDRPCPHYALCWHLPAMQVAVQALRKMPRASSWGESLVTASRWAQEAQRGTTWCSLFGLLWLFPFENMYNLSIQTLPFPVAKMTYIYPTRLLSSSSQFNYSPPYDSLWVLVSESPEIVTLLLLPH